MHDMLHNTQITVEISCSKQQTLHINSFMLHMIGSYIHKINETYCQQITIIDTSITHTENNHLLVK